ncbi:MAG: ATP-grasp domain-containing protein [Aggregatilineales bacterium]
MTMLILSPRYTDDSIRLRRAALASGWQVERLQNYRVPEHLPRTDVALYGEALFSGIIAEQLNHNLIDCPQDWLAHLPYKYLQRDVQYMTLNEARRQDYPRFVKPAAGKTFEAQVYQSAEELPAAAYQDDAMGVYVAEPVTWDIEYRCFIHNRNIITASSYRGETVNDETWSSNPDENATMQTFCSQFLSDTTIDMPVAYVLDVGRIAERGWAVIESNPVWASGLYGCESIKILPLLAAACVPQNHSRI